MRPVRIVQAFIGALALGLMAAAPPPELGRRGVVAADHVLASQAGAEVLRKGGNAVDAVIAAALAAGVVQPVGSGLGGGGFAVVRSPSGEETVIDFREVAPAGASRGMFIDAPKGASRQGGLAVAVPGEPAGLIALHDRFGDAPLRTVVAPAVRLAQGGFQVGAHLATSLERWREDFPALAAGLFASDTMPRRGDVVRRSRIAQTLDAFAATRGKALQSGIVARDIAASVQAAGGVLTEDDVSAYAPVVREPLIGTYRGWRVITMPPPSSGGIVLLQALAVLEAHDLRALGHNSAPVLHLMTEAFKHAFADRARHLGDPDRVSVPTDRLLSAERIAQIVASIDPERTHPTDFYGTPLDAGQDAGTQHISAMDAEGWSVALTTTINTEFGSGVVTERAGILLNNEMDDFVARPGVPNAFGLVGSEANAVAPGARPLSSMTPTVLVSPDGLQRISVGASGGPLIITSTLQVIVSIIDFGLDPSDAVARPRIHHQWLPDRLVLDAGFTLETRAALEARGHVIDESPLFSSVQVAMTGPAGLLAASDPRKGGWPAGVHEGGRSERVR